jgi:hypothetical protein
MSDEAVDQEDPDKIEFNRLRSRLELGHKIDKRWLMNLVEALQDQRSESSGMCVGVKMDERSAEERVDEWAAQRRKLVAQDRPQR